MGIASVPDLSAALVSLRRVVRPGYISFGAVYERDSTSVA